MSVDALDVQSLADMNKRLADLTKRLHGLDQRQREKAVESGRKKEQAQAMREELAEIDRKREAVLGEIAACERAERQIQLQEQRKQQQPPPHLHPQPPQQQHLQQQAQQPHALSPQHNSGIRTSASVRPSPAMASSSHCAAAAASAPSTSTALVACEGSAAPSSCDDDATEVPQQRPPRLLLGACLPAFLDTATVLRLVMALYERTKRFAEVRIVVAKNLAKADGADALFDMVDRATARGTGAVGRAPRSGMEGGGLRGASAPPEAKVFSQWDQRLNPYKCAAELARWADVLLVAPLCAETLKNITGGATDDLLLEVIQLWGSVKKLGPSGTQFHVPAKPFIVAPRMPPGFGHGLIIEKQILLLDEMGVEIMEDPGDAAQDGDAEETYAASAVEHVRHAVLKAQGHLQLPMMPAAAVVAAGSKRRRGAAVAT